MSRPYPRYQIWVYLFKFCVDRFGTEYFNGDAKLDNYTEINKFYNEYLTLKKLNLKEPKFTI